MLGGWESHIWPLYATEMNTDCLKKRIFQFTVWTTQCTQCLVYDNNYTQILPNCPQIPVNVWSGLNLSQLSALDLTITFFKNILVYGQS